MSEDVLIDVDSENLIATVTINREQRRNTLSGSVVQGLQDALDQLADDDDVRVMVLTGAGEKAFCAGGDIGDFQGGEGVLAMHHDRSGFADLMLAMHRFPKPIVGRINGLALGGGFGLALNCDVNVAAATAQFGTPEIKLGLFPMMIMAVIVRNIGRKKAMEMMLTGERIDAEEAKRVGVINRVAPPGELDEAVAELAGRIAGFSPAILRLGREAFYKTQDMSFEQALRHLHNELTINALAEDAAEGVMAFFGKREPEWKGK